jgi:hypothetical protein
MMRMFKRMFPRRAGIAAAALAAVMMFTFARSAAAQTGPGSSFLIAHSFNDGFTDIQFAAVGDILQLGYGGPTAPRFVFDHSGPLSYNYDTMVFQVQTAGGGSEDFSQVIGRVSISAYVDHTGALIKDGSFNSCGDGQAASFCAQAPDGTVWLRGLVKGFASHYNNNGRIDYTPLDSNNPNGGIYGPFDDFAFYIQVIGGSRAAAYGNFIAISIHAFADPSNLDTGPAFTGSFNTPNAPFSLLPNGSCLSLDAPGGHVPCSFGAGIQGVFGMSMTYGMLLDKCNGSISGLVVNGFNNAPIAGEQISVTGGPDLVTPELRFTDANGNYSFTSSALHATGLCAGTYAVRADVPDGMAPGDLYPTTRQVTFTIDNGGNDVASPAGSNVQNFAFFPVISTDFKTFGQGAWGAPPKGNNAGALLRNYYPVVYGTNPVIVGSVANSKYASMSGPLPVQNFLPQGGKPLPLDGIYIDPVTKLGQRKTHNRLGSLAGETLALQLNVDFSSASLTRFGLGGLYVASGPLANCTVGKVLSYANSVLGGGSLLTGLTNDNVEDTAEAINRNYEGGIGRGYLRATPLAAPAPACKLP